MNISDIVCFHPSEGLPSIRGVIVGKNDITYEVQTFHEDYDTIWYVEKKDLMLFCPPMRRQGQLFLLIVAFCALMLALFCLMIHGIL